MKKKVLALALAMLLSLSVLAGCGSDGGSGGGDGDGSHKIGAILYGRDDSMGAAVYAMLNYAAEALDVDLQWALNDYDAESQLASAENLIAAGCEGLIFLPISDNAVGLIGDYCESNEVYWQMMFRDIGDEDIKARAEVNPYYTGTCLETDAQTAAELVELMAADGRYNYGQGKITPGTTLAIRNDGFETGVANVGATVLADYTAPSDGSTQAYVTYVENFVNSYPEMDGILMGSASAGGGEAVINTLKGLVEPGQITIAAFDTFEGMEEGFAEGWITALVGGMSPDSLFSFMMLYNAVDGTPLADGPTELFQKFIYITSEEDCALYAQYIDNPEHMIYDADTIRSMAKRHNADVTLADLQGLMDEYSLAWVVEQANA